MDGSILKYKLIENEGFKKTSSFTLGNQNILYISSYVPRKCGIATFCRDISRGIKQASPRNIPHIMAMTDTDSENLDYPSEVKFLVRQNNWEDYLSILDHINTTNSFNLICLQHEFGIFGGADGDFIIPFLEKNNLPVTTTLHTILPKPTPNQKRIIQYLCRRSGTIIIMLEEGKKILSKVYGVSLQNIEVIPHGVPTFSQLNQTEAKKELNLDNKIVMTGINLLSEGKGVEYGIRSLPFIVKEIPSFIYQIVGETHPSFVAYLGGRDTFREKLVKLAKDLGVEKNIRFVNKYVSVSDLVKYVEASDFYLTPYLDPQQATSGALAYAIGAGKVCISTPYVYAKEMLKNNGGVLVPFKNSESIARAVLSIMKNPNLRSKIEKRTYEKGRSMTWESIGKQYQKLFDSLLSPSPALKDYTPMVV